MIDVVPERDVVAENFLAHAVVEARAFVENRGGGKIVEKKSDEVEDGRRLENRGVVTGRQLSRLARACSFLAGAFCKTVGVEFANVRRIGLCPARRIGLENCDG